MYNFNGFGGRISVLRKQHGLTQDDLATRLGVTPQAVSKWENDQSYPDIAMLPSIAMILNTDMDYLFGAGDEPDFKPQSEIDGLKLVATFGYSACYSNKAVESVQGSFIKFTDGSHAELTNGNVSNTGQGSIRIHTEEHDEPRKHERNRREERESEMTFIFDESNSIDIQVLKNECEIVTSSDNKTRVEINADQRFIDAARVDCTNGKLTLRFENYKQGLNFLSRRNPGHVLIEVPYTIGKSAVINVNGSGTLESNIKYEQGALNIHGSGDISMTSFDDLKATIHGSGDIEIASVNNTTSLSIHGSGDISIASSGDTSADIHGSGDISIASVKSIAISINGSGSLDIGDINGGDSKFNIMGSGDITIGGGKTDSIQINIMGSGDIHAEGLTARVANISARSGSVVLGRVIERSTEQGKKNNIQIRQRG